jgi:hypothetical protein
MDWKRLQSLFDDLVRAINCRIHSDTPTTRDDEMIARALYHKALREVVG